ncbi:MAG: hypothetical protein Q9200_006717, partial [Gallowayella weberi]
SREGTGGGVEFRGGLQLGPGRPQHHLVRWARSTLRHYDAVPEKGGGFDPVERHGNGLLTDAEEAPNPDHQADCATVATDDDVADITVGLVVRTDHRGAEHARGKPLPLGLGCEEVGVEFGGGLVGV